MEGGIIMQVIENVEQFIEDYAKKNNWPSDWRSYKNTLPIEKRIELGRLWAMQYASNKVF